MGSNIFKSRLGFSLLLMVVLSIFIAIPALAGEGDGSGGGKDVPLALASSSPANGEAGVGLQPVIKLTFNKNVINLAIREANKKCFSLVSSAGTNIAIEVIMADDQIYPEEKRNISLKPLQSLQPDSSYTIKISPQLQAKNGTSLGHEVTVKFKTAAAPAETAKPVPTAPSTVDKLPDASVANQPAAGTDKTQTTVKNNQVKSDEKTVSPQVTEQKDTVSATRNQTANKTAESSSPLSQKQQQDYLWMAEVGLAVLAALGYLVYRKRNSK